ncbi:response regulator transcription factor [Aureibacillus halotolerans]|uniref:DNA-binding response OmpR family regulator n=1 Tax=Aureibacillus halotolerans TaxID=1508390 RepID=A0A4R6U2Z5_9BACI|nr:response regulator transcription factor [Aureibacillus halotolerans]TDQ38765.1 DNA-binding response OmpR family regulator [Aureibacillus halotolerans]
MANEKIMVVDDDIEINEILTLYLRKNGFQVISADEGPKAVELVRLEQPDLILLDVLLPGLDGFDVCREIRQLTKAPILFVSSKNDEIDKVLGLGLGADDFITKPFSPNELVARVKAHIRRNTFFNESDTVKTPKVLFAGDLEVDLLRHVCKLHNKEVSLSKKEFELLSVMIQRPDQTFTLDDLYNRVWGLESLSDTRTVMVHIHNLRKKIELDPANPNYILTVRGIGYRFNGEACTDEPTTITTASSSN